jgi:hypothetical protein
MRRRLKEYWKTCEPIVDQLNTSKIRPEGGVLGILLQFIIKYNWLLEDHPD